MKYLGLLCLESLWYNQYQEPKTLLEHCAPYLLDCGSVLDVRSSQGYNIGRSRTILFELASLV